MSPRTKELHPKKPARRTKASETPQALETYRKKRDPERTPEPFGGAVSAAEAPAGKAATSVGERFVVQLHAARNLHFDLRLELDGVLKSWAVPKGPSVRAEEKRLAVHVEDHPLEYANFEGVIPAGNYGAGSVIVWDRGAYRSFKPEPIREQYERGKMELELFGHKLGGRWTLVRMSRKEKEWLLLKKADGAAADVDVLEQWPRSVICGLTVEEMRDPEGWLSGIRDHVQKLKAPRRDVRAKAIKPMLATLVDEPFSGRDWVFEIKYDGVRVIAEKRGEGVHMYGRSGEEITARYPEIAEALHGLQIEQGVFDGEIVAYDEEGRPSFSRLQKRMLLTKPRDIAAAMARVPARAIFFDCIALEGCDLRGLGLLDRKECLARVLPPAGIVQASDHVDEHGEAFFEAASQMRLEGIIAKRKDSKYVDKRTKDWMKIKCQNQQEFVIGGYTESPGTGRRFGALHVGVYDEGGKTLTYVTKVGSGFDNALMNKLWKEFQTIGRDDSPFGASGPRGRGDHWVDPRLVCDVRFTEWTRDGGLRHPTFLGLRTDKKPKDVHREEPIEFGSESEQPTDEDGMDGKGGDVPPPASSSRSASPAHKGAPASAAHKGAPASARKKATPRRGETETREVRLSNLNKIFWPDERYTKGDLIGYYDSVAPFMLPYLRERPAVLTRYPDGIKGKSFYQKDAPVFIPDWIRTETVYSKDSDRDIKFFVIDDPETLRYVANLGTIPIHMWSSRSGSLEQPDWLALDLDPKGAPFRHVVEVARALHGILEELDLPSYPKTSGASGIHILIPLGRRYTHEECRTFARLLATLGLHATPKISTMTRSLHARAGKVYIDWGQNGHGITIAAPYSLRPLPGAPASCPLEWDEVNAKLDPARFNLKTLPKRFQTMKDPLLPVLGKGINMGVAIRAIEKRLKDMESES